MVAPRWRKVGRDLSTHRFRTALVAVSIAIGIFAVGVVMGGREILVREFDADYAQAVAAGATYYTGPFDDEVVRRAGDRAEVSRAQGRHETTLRYRWRGSDDPATLSIVAMRDYADIAVQKILPEGDLQWPIDRGEIVLEGSALQVGEYRVGDVLEVETADGTKVPLEVVGFAHDLNAVPAQFVGAETGYVAFETLSDLEEPEYYNSLLITFEQEDISREDASRLAADIRSDVLEARGVAVFGTSVPEPGSHFLGDIFKAVSLLLLALGVLSLALSGFLVVNTVSAIMAQQVRQIGIMKALGGRTGQLTRMYLVTVAAYGALAVVLGLPSAALAGRYFTEFAADILNFNVTSYVPPAWVTVLEVSVGLVVPLLAAIIPIRMGSRMSVVRALNSTGMSAPSFGHGLGDRLLGLVRGLPRPVALSIRNTFLRKGRLLLTLATLTLAAAVVMSVVSVQGSINRTIADLEEWWNYDAQVVLGQTADSAMVEREVVQVSGVTAVESWSGHPVAYTRADGSENQSMSLFGLPYDTTFVRPRLVAGRWLQAGDTDAVVINSDVVKDEPAIALGQRFALTVAGEERSWRVVGVIKGQLSGAVIYADRDSLGDLLGDQGVNRVLLRTELHMDDAQQAAMEAAEQALDEAGYQVVSTRTQSGLSQTISEQLGILVTFLVIMAVLLAAVGVIGLTGSMTLNVLESTREIGVMRAIGAQHRSIYQIFMSEGLVVGVMSWGLGAVLSYPMSWLLTGALADSTQIPLTYEFSWPGVAGTFVVIALVSAVASVLPASRASRVSVRDAIAYE
ncbi:MAG: FtsX-like permease family protein [Coriobacteriia bacterium]|nr:FtsX-like permease family protein [Coriobacteriia bacterium]